MLTDGLAPHGVGRLELSMARVGGGASGDGIAGDRGRPRRALRRVGDVLARRAEPAQPRQHPPRGEREDEQDHHLRSGALPGVAPPVHGATTPSEGAVATAETRIEPGSANIRRVGGHRDAHDRTVGAVAGARDRHRVDPAPAHPGGEAGGRRIGGLAPGIGGRRGPRTLGRGLLEDVAGVPPDDDLTEEEEQGDQEHGREQDLDARRRRPGRRASSTGDVGTGDRRTSSSRTGRLSRRAPPATARWTGRR